MRTIACFEKYGSATASTVPALAVAPKLSARIGLSPCLLSLLLLVLSFSLFAETLALQSFENQPTDTWSYTANPSPDAKRIWWGPTTEIMGGASAYDGTVYWAGWDLDNLESTVSFSTLNLQAGFTYNVSFYYYTKNLATTNDYCRYSVKYDNGTNWDGWVTVNNNSNAWTAVSVDVPSGSNFLRLRLSSKFDGSTKYAHWDYIKVEKTPIPNAAPVVSNVTAGQRTDGSKTVDIYYDLYDANAELCDISFKLSSDNGASYSIVPSPANLSGDFGDDLPGGTGKHIVWNAGAESYGLDGSYLYRVYADDGSSPPMPENFVFIPGGTIYPGQGIYTGGLTVSDFYIDKFELTNAEWNAVMGSGGGDSYPHAYVSWFGAIEYCNRRSMMEGLPACYSYLTYGTNPDNWPSGWNSTSGNSLNVSCDWTASGYRLLSEAEWEYAARGGLNTHGYTFSGSNDLNLVGWYGGNSGYISHPVGQLAANELGTFDMSGNLWEWCWDVYSGSARVWRGGYFDADADFCAVSYRAYVDATYSHSHIGFRICRVSP